MKVLIVINQKKMRGLIALVLEIIKIDNFNVRVI